MNFLLAVIGYLFLAGFIASFAVLAGYIANKVADQKNNPLRWGRDACIGSIPIFFLLAMRVNSPTSWLLASGLALTISFLLAAAVAQWLSVRYLRELEEVQTRAKLGGDDRVSTEQRLASERNRRNLVMLAVVGGLLSLPIGLRLRGNYQRQANFEALKAQLSESRYSEALESAAPLLGHMEQARDFSKDSLGFDGAAVCKMTVQCHVQLGQARPARQALERLKLRYRGDPDLPRLTQEVEKLGK
jgi:hypothetical protein